MNIKVMWECNRMQLETANARDPVEIGWILNSLIYFTLKNTTDESRCV